MEFLKIIALAVLAAVVYGILHDQITARLCVEYFSVAHPPVWGGTTDPTLLAFTWGVIATWWVGMILGVPLAVVARVGRWPKRSARSMVKPIGVVLVCMAVSAACAGTIGYRTAPTAGHFYHCIVGGGEIPTQAVPWFYADAWAHLASYGGGAVGGMVLMGWVIVARWRSRNSATGRQDELASEKPK